MNLPYTMTPAAAAEAVKAFRPGIVRALEGAGIEVRLRNWYE